MHQLQIINRACDGDPDPITIQVMDMTHAKPDGSGGNIVRAVVLKMNKATTVLLPPGCAMLITETTHVKA